MVSPRVTVIIATYNWSTVLPYSIGSVLAQTFTDFELLVVGDGCTDDSEAVVAAIEDPRVRWINTPHFGHQSGPNNEGLRQARGEIVAYLGHDDLWLPHHLAQHVAMIDAQYDFTCSFTGFIGPDASFIDTGVPDFQRMRMLPPSACVHRLDIARSVEGWRDYRALRVTPEVDLISRLAASGARMAIVPRLTALKFPASLRRNVYRHRPAHEQREWFARIRSEPALEAALFAHILITNPRQLDGLANRVWRILRHPGQWWAILNPRKGARIRAYQRLKGVR